MKKIILFFCLLLMTNNLQAKTKSFILVCNSIATTEKNNRIIKKINLTEEFKFIYPLWLIGEGEKSSASMILRRINTSSDIYTFDTWYKSPDTLVNNRYASEEIKNTYYKNYYKYFYGTMEDGKNRLNVKKYDFYLDKDFILRGSINYELASEFLVHLRMNINFFTGNYFASLDYPGYEEDINIRGKCKSSPDIYKFLKSKSSKNISSTRNSTSSTSKVFSYWWVVFILIALAAFIYTQLKPGKSKKVKIPKSKISSQKNVILTFIPKLWRGEFSLAISFWVCWIIPSMFFSLVVLVPVTGTAEIILGYFALFFYIYAFIAIRGTWYSANHYKAEKEKKNQTYGWASAAHIYIFLSVLGFIFRIFKLIL